MALGNRGSERQIDNQAAPSSQASVPCEDNGNAVANIENDGNAVANVENDAGNLSVIEEMEAEVDQGNQQHLDDNLPQLTFRELELVAKKEVEPALAFLCEQLIQYQRPLVEMALGTIIILDSDIPKLKLQLLTDDPNLPRNISNSQAGKTGNTNSQSDPKSSDEDTMELNSKYEEFCHSLE